MAFLILLLVWKLTVESKIFFRFYLVKWFGDTLAWLHCMMHVQQCPAYPCVFAELFENVKNCCLYQTCLQVPWRSPLKESLEEVKTWRLLEGVPSSLWLWWQRSNLLQLAGCTQRKAATVVTAPHVVRERNVAMALTYSFALLPVPLKQM